MRRRRTDNGRDSHVWLRGQRLRDARPRHVDEVHPHHGDDHPHHPQGRGPLAEGEWDQDLCRVICPRHGSAFDLETGTPLSLPAYEPVETYPVTVEDGIVQVEVAE